MLDGLRQFIAEVVSSAGHEDRVFDDTGYRLAATALLIHVVRSTASRRNRKTRKLHSLIEKRRADPGTADHLIVAATRIEARRSISIISPASSCARSTRKAGSHRRDDVGAGFADGQVSEFEDNVIWRAADLLGCPRATGSS
jgi:uncharacterized tellurite resistance protein B-like protein